MKVPVGSEKLSVESHPTGEEPYDESFSRHYDALIAESPFYVVTREYCKILRGDIKGLNILDVGCGGGIECRNMIQQGAASVTGIDISPYQLDKAIVEEAAKPLGITYCLANASKLPSYFQGIFDLVISSFCLCHANNVQELTNFLSQIYWSLKPGGKIVCSSTLAIQTAADSKQKYEETKTRYGIAHSGFNGILEEGQEFNIHFKLLNGMEKIIKMNYFPENTFVTSMNEIGFIEVQIVHIRTCPEALTQRLNEIEPVLRDPLGFFVTAKRPT